MPENSFMSLIANLESSLSEGLYSGYTWDSLSQPERPFVFLSWSISSFGIPLDALMSSFIAPWEVFSSITTLLDAGKGGFL